MRESPTMVDSFQLELKKKVHEQKATERAGDGKAERYGRYMKRKGSVCN